jgi:hypothetical protein
MLDFPANPTNGQIFTPVVGGPSWQWDSQKWVAATTGSVTYAPITDPVFLGNPQAPQPAAGDADASIATTAFVTNAVATSLHDVGRNYLHNSMFNVRQRGNGTFSTNGYNADRWSSATIGAGSSTSVLMGLLLDADRTQIGDEAALYSPFVTFTGTAAAGDYTFVEYQGIEGVRRLAGKTVTVSFWARWQSGNPKLGLCLYQYFGAGGSPSAGVNGIGAQSFTLTGSWVRYVSAPITIPSSSGKTLGTDGLDQTQLIFWGSSGATNNAASGGIGVQSGGIALWGVQLEIGPTATPLEKLDPVTQLQQCQRFYSTGLAAASSNAGGAGQGAYTGVTLPVTMRAIPTITFSAPTFSNSNTTVTSAILSTAFIFLTNAAAGGIFSTQTNWQASADL